MEPPIKLERFAQLRAEIEHGASLDDLLEREGMSPETWASAEQLWNGKLADEAAQKRFVLTNRYKTAFNTKARLLDAKRPAPQAPVEPAPAPEPVAAALPIPPVAPSQTPPPATPFIAGAPLSPATFAPAPYAPPQYTPPPYTPPPAVAPLQPSEASRMRELGGTLSIGDGAHVSEVMPFLKAAAEAAPTTERARSPQEQGTFVPAMPFVTPSPKGAPPINPSATTPWATPPAHAANAKKQSSTVALDRDTFLKEVLPFLKAGAEGNATAPSPPQKAEAAIPLVNKKASVAKAPGQDLSGTLDLDHDAVQAQVTPFLKAAKAEAAAPERVRATSDSPPAPTPGSRFTVEQFASLSAELFAAPGRLDEVRARYGLDEASHRAEAERWRELFARDKDLMARYTSLLQRYRDWLARGAK